MKKYRYLDDLQQEPWYRLLKVVFSVLLTVTSIPFALIGGALLATPTDMFKGAVIFGLIHQIAGTTFGMIFGMILGASLGAVLIYFLVTRIVYYIFLGRYVSIEE